MQVLKAKMIATNSAWIGEQVRELIEPTAKIQFELVMIENPDLPDENL